MYRLAKFFIKNILKHRFFLPKIINNTLCIFFPQFKVKKKEKIIEGGRIYFYSEDGDTLLIKSYIVIKGEPYHLHS